MENQDKIYIDALFYRLQLAIDASMDVIAMLCKDLGIKVRDDYTNREKIKELNIFSPELVKNLRKFNGLRNALVHKNNKVQEDLILQQKEDIRENLNLFVKKGDIIINEKF
ncbi:MAG: DUF86 domain-containing protein [Promethearchaeati archaeon]